MHLREGMVDLRNFKGKIRCLHCGNNLLAAFSWQCGCKGTREFSEIFSSKIKLFCNKDPITRIRECTYFVSYTQHNFQVLSSWAFLIQKSLYSLLLKEYLMICFQKKKKTVLSLFQQLEFYSNVYMCDHLFLIYPSKYQYISSTQCMISLLSFTISFLTWDLSAAINSSMFQSNIIISFNVNQSRIILIYHFMWALFSAESHHKLISNYICKLV